MYSDACQLGISYDNYWDIEPIEIYNIAQQINENKRKEFIDKLNNEMAIAWYSASLQGIAMNDPKKFPKKPPKYETEEEKNDKVKLLAYKLDAMMKSNKSY